jgi:hypothetical protein
MLERSRELSSGFAIELAELRIDWNRSWTS